MLIAVLEVVTVIVVVVVVLVVGVEVVAVMLIVWNKIPLNPLLIPVNETERGIPVFLLNFGQRERENQGTVLPSSDRVCSESPALRNWCC